MPNTEIGQAQLSNAAKRRDFRESCDFEERMRSPATRSILRLCSSHMTGLAKYGEHTAQNQCCSFDERSQCATHISIERRVSSRANRQWRSSSIGDEPPIEAMARHLRFVQLDTPNHVLKNRSHTIPRFTQELNRKEQNRRKSRNIALETSQQSLSQRMEQELCQRSR